MACWLAQPHAASTTLGPCQGATSQRLEHARDDEYADERLQWSLEEAEAKVGRLVETMSRRPRPRSSRVGRGCTSLISAFFWACSCQPPWARCQTIA